MIYTAIRWAGLAVLVALAFCAIAAGFAFLQLRETTLTFDAELQKLQVTVDSSLLREAALTRAVLLAQVDPIRAELKATRELIDRQATGARADAVRVLSAGLVLLDARAAAATRPVELLQADLSRSLAGVDGVMAETRGLMFQVNDAAPLYLDCQGNPSCAYNLFQGTAKAAQSIAQDVARTAPAMLADSAKITGHVEGIAADAHLVADRIVAPKTRKQKAWEVVKLGVFGVSRLWGN